jgi:hypothetical protein
MTPESVISLLAVTMLSMAWAMWLLPVGTCTECTHCRAEKLARQRANEARNSRFYGIPICPACGRHHQREEDHRS